MVSHSFSLWFFDYELHTFLVTQASAPIDQFAEMFIRMMERGAPVNLRVPFWPGETVAYHWYFYLFDSENFIGAYHIVFDLPWFWFLL